MSLRVLTPYLADGFGLHATGRRIDRHEKVVEVARRKRTEYARRVRHPLDQGGFEEAAPARVLVDVSCLSQERLFVASVQRTQDVGVHCAQPKRHLRTLVHARGGLAFPLTGLARRLPHERIEHRRPVLVCTVDHLSPEVVCSGIECRYSDQDHPQPLKKWNDDTIN